MERDGAPVKFGTFGGVFTPCVLTILGVIMFLRFGLVVGQAGLLYALLIVGVSKTITGLTTLSLSAIATNTRVKGGGAYYVISRSLGVEFGGAIGLVFFLAQAISVAMYVIGFAEAFVGSIPGTGVSMTTVATITNIGVFICVLIGAGWTIKLQYFILAVLVAAIGSFIVGSGQAFDAGTFQTNLTPNFSEGESLFSMFALFFPAVTGIMAGANMSGDLRDPARSIPRGTLWAVLVTAIVYLGMAGLLAGARPSAELIGNSLIVADIATWPLLITAGVFAATLSSALGSMMGAPRILQAFARDNVFSWLTPFASGSGTSNEPRRAVVITFAISQACILSADLNTIAPLITMFFMITYGLLNLATFYEAITKNPSYRPRFRYSHWTTSLAGAVGCLVVMFLIDWRWALTSIAAMALLHQYISRKEVEARWGDLQSGLLFERTRRNLLRLEDQMYHPKNWRPIILALSGAGWDRPQLAVYGHWFTSGQGILTLGQVIQGEIENRLERRTAQERILHDFIRTEQLEAFPAVVVAPYLADGIESLVQCQGMGALRSNTVMIGWPTDTKRAEAFGATLRTIASLQRSIISVRFKDDPDDPWVAPSGTIDVWWRGRQNGSLMLLLAHLLTKTTEWRNRPIRLMRVIENEAGVAEVESHLRELADEARIIVTPIAIVSSNAMEDIRRTSRDAALVLMGFEAPDEGDEQSFYDRMEQWSGDLLRVVFVDSIGEMSLES
ncbi:MAG TPA: amino acid permease [Pirellulaceae bacterium]|nr:amino acid permease [Planctomycetales bacterium]MCB9941792.1 amino acid permease [Planctomycetaceae bacterium]HRX77473.1 amino acid permease [Pirellulaceae bacterium]